MRIGSICRPRHLAVRHSAHPDFPATGIAEFGISSGSIQPDEAFRMQDPVTNFNGSNFGQVTSAYDPRIMQFALKYLF